MAAESSLTCQWEECTEQFDEPETLFIRELYTHKLHCAWLY